MADVVFIVGNDSSLMPLREQRYESEELLQKLLADHPSLLSHDVNQRWLLVERECGVPDREGGSNRWSLDHLFLDEEGVPTLVEVKRSDDPRLRREVVGQMLDYAANGIAWWPLEHIQGAFDARCEDEGLDATFVIEEFVGPEEPVDQFWQRVKTNLQAGRIRMVFVADVIPPELQRVVEFLNTQMDPAEVIALEVRQFVGEGVRTLMPRVIGRTAESARRKTPTTAPKLTEDQLLERIDDPEARDAVRELLATTRDAGGVVYLGTTGVSLRMPVAGGSTPVSVAWYFPPGVYGWCGLTDLTLGYDRAGSVRFDVRSQDQLARYASSAKALEGVSEVTSKSIEGAAIRSSKLPGLKHEVVTLIQHIATSLQDQETDEPAEGGETV